mmetsp:Transcript_18945/g.29184  ORF Transcript_18945/g.29184 Transcript_18945/m.29184 type:complete len:638 (+) Transcript_18945:249-2162(+)|eukprot:CAMPEP_0195295624 /NCGR_PEP_ID=MMETSP0707-20130614/17743_1 /TAXON_ID=33640 /ORGANISM="Asterionellopsis glacialis, Strain CCMP134" /LENGTH=637 /DNA_ID=CAMNT_0040356893 /DNA_START=127 /DNA_END=2040 /DNA_ORIENTATION=-
MSPSSQSGRGRCAPFLCGCTTANDVVDASRELPGAETAVMTSKKQHKERQHVAFENVDVDEDESSLEFVDTFEGNDEDWQGIKFVSEVPKTPSGASVGRPASPASFASGKSVYFDAEEYDRVSLYPPIVSNKVPPSPVVSMQEPRSLCRTDKDDHDQDLANKEASMMDLVLPEFDEEAKEKFEKTSKMIREKSHQNQAGLFKQARRNTAAIRKELESPGVLLQERGFPGQLDAKELQRVQQFREELKKRDPVYQEIVYQFVGKGVEEEAYALCRFLRARKYEPEQVFELLDQGKDIWKIAKAADFHEDVEEAMGVSLPLFSRMYPFVYHGNAKNGCPVAYLKAGELDANCVKCVITMNEVYPYFWNQYMHVFAGQLANGKSSNPQFVRCEAINVFDMKGFSRAQVTDTAIDVVKISGHISTCFPETLHCLVILNAPTIFSFAWSIAKKFIDARTASKVEIYSNTKEGNKRLEELIDTQSIPSDFGGTAPALSTLLRNVGADSNDTSKPKIKFTELMQLKRNKKAKHKFDIDESSSEEKYTLTIYTCSLMGATFSVFQDDSLLNEVEVSKKAIGNSTQHTSNVTTPTKRRKSKIAGPENSPYRMEIATFSNSGKFRVEGKSLGTDGHFLIVCESTAMN